MKQWYAFGHKLYLLTAFGAPQPTRKNREIVLVPDSESGNMLLKAGFWGLRNWGMNGNMLLKAGFWGLRNWGIIGSHLLQF